MRHLIDGLVDIHLRLAGHQQAKIGAVGSQIYAVAVQDQPTRRRNQLKVELIAGGEFLVPLRLDQLQIGQPAHQGRHAQDRDPTHQKSPAVEDPLPLIDLTEENRGL